MGTGDSNASLGANGGSSEKTKAKRETRVSRELHAARVKAFGSGMTVEQYAQDVARSFGLSVTPINYKDQKSTVRKYRNEIRDARAANKKEGTRKRTHDIDRQMRDLVRNTIIYNSDTQKRQGEALKRHLDNEAKRGALTDTKIQDMSSSSGYRGFMAHIKTGKRTQGEIQVLSDKMIYAKELPKNAKLLIGVKRYNEISKQTGIEGGMGHCYYEKIRVEKDPKKIKELNRKSRNYYKNFY